MNSNILATLKKNRPAFQFCGSDALAEKLQLLLQQEDISKTDWRFAALLEQFEATETELLEAAALCSAALAQGSTCIEVANKAICDDSALVCVQPAADDQLTTPLVLHGDKLFLQRYYSIERDIAQLLQQRYQIAEKNSSCLQAEREGSQHVPLNAQQQQAVYSALQYPVCLITGGPGTGKTTVVASILNAIKEIYPQHRVGLATPTGKAAARLQQSLERAIPKGQQVTNNVETLHRLLGSHRSLSATYKFNEQNLLPLDFLIIDESSMIDSALMHAILVALPISATLIMLGDAQQLPSVGAGRVFADLCDAAKQKKYISDGFVELDISYRFADYPAIGTLANAILQSDVQAVLEFESDDTAVAQAAAVVPIKDEAETLEKLLQPYQHLIEQARKSASLEDYLKLIDEYQILASSKHSSLGVNAINTAAQHKFSSNSNVREGDLFEAMPVMVNQNHHSLGLYNGDTGVVVKQEGKLLFAFPSGKEVMYFLPSQLTDWQPCFAMTVHKAQGSEYRQVAIVLAEQFSKKQESLLSKELLYTAVTRAKQAVSIHYQIKSLELAVQTSQTRLSGLLDFI